MGDARKAHGGPLRVACQATRGLPDAPAERCRCCVHPRALPPSSRRACILDWPAGHECHADAHDGVGATYDGKAGGAHGCQELIARTQPCGRRRPRGFSGSRGGLSLPVAPPYKRCGSRALSLPSGGCRRWPFVSTAPGLPGPTLDRHGSPTQAASVYSPWTHSQRRGMVIGGL